MEYWSDGLEAVGVRLTAQGVRGKRFALHLTPYTSLCTHYSSTPTLHYSMWMAQTNCHQKLFHFIDL